MLAQEYNNPQAPLGQSISWAYIKAHMPVKTIILDGKAYEDDELANLIKSFPIDEDEDNEMDFVVCQANHQIVIRSWKIDRLLIYLV